MLYKVIWNEIRKEMLTAWSYKFQWLGELLSLLFFFIFLMIITKNSQIASVNYCLWLYSINIIGDISGKISTEMRSGTFEQLYLSSIPIPYILFAKLMSTIVKSFIIMLSLFCVFLCFGYTIFNNTIYHLVFFAIFIVPGLFGLSLFFGGLTILLNDTGWMLNVLNNSLLFFSGIFIHVENLPKWIQYFTEINLITISCKCIEVGGFINILYLSTLNCIYLIIGINTFWICEKKAKSNGYLGRY